MPLTYPEAAPQLADLHPGVVVETEDGLYWVVDRRTEIGVVLAARSDRGREPVSLLVSQLGYITDWDAA